MILGSRQENLASVESGDTLERQLGIQKMWAGSRVIFAAVNFQESHQMV